MISEQAKSNYAQVLLPGGYLGDDGQLIRDVVLREMTGDEEDFLTSSGIPLIERMERLMVACTDKFGTFEGKEKIGIIVPKMLQLDRSCLLLAIRKHSTGEIFRYTAKCKNEKCSEFGKEQVKIIDLNTLAVKPQPHPEQLTYEVPLPSGKRAVMRMITGVEERKMPDVRKEMSENLMTAALVLRVVSIDDVVPDEQGLMLRKMVSRDRNALRQAFVKAEGDLDQNLEWTCKVEECGYEGSSFLDMADPGFFFPSET